MKIRFPFEMVSDLKDLFLIKVVSHDLKADGKAIS